MKKFAILFIILFANIAVCSEPNEIDALRAKYKQLKLDYDSQKQILAKIKKEYTELRADYNDVKHQLDEKIKENEILLKKSSNQKKFNETKTFKYDPNIGIVYKGKTRDNNWFENMYSRYSNLIVLYNNKYEYIDDLPPVNVFNPTTWHDPRFYAWKVLSVINNNEILIRHVGGVETIYHICGLNGNYVDDAIFDENKIFIYTGTYKYASAFGANNTVSSFCAYKPLTREQFAEAINEGFMFDRHVKKSK